MKSSLRNIGLSLAFFFALAANAGQHPVGFQAWNGVVPQFNAAPGTPVFFANQAFVTKYGAERGFLGTGVGAQGQLIVLVSDWRFSREIWRKMIGAGDAFSAAGGAGYIYYQDDSTNPPGANYVYAGKLNIQEGYTGTFPILNGTPAITGFMVAMEEKCGMGRAGVQPVYQVQPTQLIGSRRLGAYTIGYEYSVNNGEAALVSGVSVTVARRHLGPFIVDICPVDLYLRY